MIKKLTGHIDDWCNSRGYHKEFVHNAPCECCPIRIHITGDKKRNTFMEVHHNVIAFRGRRTHNKDGTDLIGVCRECHDLIHSRRNNSTKEMLDLIISRILDYSQQIRHEGLDPIEGMRQHKDMIQNTILQIYSHYIADDEYKTS